MLRKIFGIYLLLVILAACTLDEAKAPVHSHVIVYTDQYVPEDSSFIQEFEAYSHIHVKVIFKPSSEIIALLKGNKYNVGFDAILTKTDTIRQMMKEREMLHRISNARLFRNLNRQFNNNHYLWLPVSHNPLILEVSLDSSQNCDNLAWSKILKDSSAMNIHLIPAEINYYKSLMKGGSRYATILNSKNAPYSKRDLIKLSDLVEDLKSKKIAEQKCRHLLNEHQRMFTTFTSISINKFARNKAEAIKFLDYYGKFNYQIASNRNELSTFNGIISNYQISELKISQ